MKTKEKLETTNGHTDRTALPPVADKKDELRIAPLRMAIVTVPIIGVTPLKILRFSKKKQSQVQATQEAGSQARSKKTRAAKDFNAEYEDAKYLCTQRVLSTEGPERDAKYKEGDKTETWLGLNATGVRNGCIETCRVAGMVMTRAKMSVFCEADGIDDLDATPLVRVFGTPEMTIDHVRNASGVIDLRPRVMFREWRMVLRIRFDEDQFSASDIVNLLVRVGAQNGLGEGRANGTNGNGCGNGEFKVDIDNISLERLSTKAVFNFDAK